MLLDARISNIRFTPAPLWMQRGGKRGWVRCTLFDGFELDRLCVRRTKGGGYTVTFPRHRDRNGILHFVFRPRTPEARNAIVQPVLDYLLKRRLLP